MNRALLSAIALCFAAAGCEQKPAEPPKPKTAAAVVPLPPEAPKAAAASAGQDAKPVQMAGTQAGAPKTAKRPGTKGCGDGKCVVRIKDVTPGTPYCTATFNAKDLEVAGADQTITWHVTGGWKFDKDGIDLPTGGGQFSRPDGEGTTKYSWVDANTDDKAYKYFVRLVKGKDKCVIDPSVVNGADIVDASYPPP